MLRVADGEIACNLSATDLQYRIAHLKGNDMSNTLNADLENAYKQFQLGDLPIYHNLERISIRKLFKILTITELKDLPTIEAMNFYLYCQFFKNRLLYSPLF